MPTHDAMMYTDDFDFNVLMYMTTDAILEECRCLKDLKASYYMPYDMFVLWASATGFKVRRIKDNVLAVRKVLFPKQWAMHTTRAFAAQSYETKVESLSLPGIDRVNMVNVTHMANWHVCDWHPAISLIHNISFVHPDLEEQGDVYTFTFDDQEKVVVEVLNNGDMITVVPMDEDTEDFSSYIDPNMGPL